MFWLAVTVILTIGISFTCSLWEAALYSVPPGRVESLRRQGTSRGRELAALRENMDRPVSAILTLNTIAHTVGATVAGSLVQEYYGGENLMVFSITFVLAILIFSEIIPKTLGYAHSHRLAPAFAWPIKCLIWILYPAVILSQWITRMLKPKRVEAFPTEADVLSVAHLGVRSGGILPEELKWLNNVLRLNNVEARDIMTPVSKMEHLDADLKLSEVQEEVGRWAHARIPLTKNGDTNNVVGIVRRHEVISAICEGNKEMKLSELKRPVQVVPPQMRAHRLLKEMIRRRQQLFVISENGKTIGIVTLEDVIEEMLGEEIMNEPAVPTKKDLPRSGAF